MLGFTSKMKEEVSKTEVQQLPRFPYNILSHPNKKMQSPSKVKLINFKKELAPWCKAKSYQWNQPRTSERKGHLRFRSERKGHLRFRRTIQAKSQKETSTEWSYNKASNTFDLIIKCNKEDKRARVPEKDGRKKRQPSWSKQRPRAIQMRSHGQK